MKALTFDKDTTKKVARLVELRQGYVARDVDRHDLRVLQQLLPGASAPSSDP